MRAIENYEDQLIRRESEIRNSKYVQFFPSSSNNAGCTTNLLLNFHCVFRRKKKEKVSRQQEKLKQMEDELKDWQKNLKVYQEEVREDFNLRDGDWEKFY